MKRFVKWIKYLYHISKGFRFNVAFRIVAGIANVGLTLTFIWLSKYTIDTVTSSHHCDNGRLIFLVGMISACIISTIGVTQLAKYMEARATVRMNIRVSRWLFNGLMGDALQHGRYRFHSGDMLNRLTVDLKTVVDFVLAQIPAMVIMAVQLAAAFAFLAYLNPALALITLGIMPVCLLAGKLYFRRQRQLAAAIRSNEGSLQVTMQEGLKHRTTLQSLECVDTVLSRHSSLQEELDDNSRHQARLATLSRTMTRMGFTLGYLMAFGWGVFNLNAGLITFGTLTAFIQLVGRLQAPIAGLAGYVPTIVSSWVAADRLQEIGKFDTEDSGGERCVIKGTAGIRVQNLTFAYDQDSENIFKDFCYDFQPGTVTAIVGETGIGKSTLVKLFLGLLAPQGGSITLYGGNKEYPVSGKTRCNFVYVPQGNSLLSGSIRDNLLLADPSATDETLAEVLRLAQATFVFDLPMGLDTPCDESGNGLSVGQAQRIAIARALLRPGSIMVFDEFNSALDQSTAEALTKAIVTRYPNATIIFISHRPYIKAYCDAILSLDSIK